MTSSVTADTNIYISGLQFNGVNPRRFLDLAADGIFRLDISDAILHETLRVLRDKFKWSNALLQETEGEIRAYTHHVTPTQTLEVITRDLSDRQRLPGERRHKRRAAARQPCPDPYSLGGPVSE